MRCARIPQHVRNIDSTRYGKHHYRLGVITQLSEAVFFLIRYQQSSYVDAVLSNFSDLYLFYKFFHRSVIGKVSKDAPTDAILSLLDQSDHLAFRLWIVFFYQI